MLETRPRKFTAFSYKTPIFRTCENTKNRPFSNWPIPHNKRTLMFSCSQLKLQRAANYKITLSYLHSIRNSHNLFGSLKQQGTGIHQFLPIIGFQDQTSCCQSRYLTPISVFFALIRSRIIAVVHRPS